MSKSKEVVVEVSRAEYEKQLADALTDEEILRPGKHVFKRGGFRERHPNYNHGESKARINIYIDMDVIDYFRARANKPHAAPYQTQINAELRAVMEHDLANEMHEIDDTAKKLLNDDDFLKAISERLKEKELLTT